MLYMLFIKQFYLQFTVLTYNRSVRTILGRKPTPSLSHDLACHGSNYKNLAISNVSSDKNQSIMKYLTRQINSSPSEKHHVDFIWIIVIDSCPMCETIFVSRQGLEPSCKSELLMDITGSVYEELNAFARLKHGWQWKLM